MEGTSDTYAECTPCKMHGSVFGVLETNNCPNAFIEKTLILFRTLFVNFFHNKNISRGVHRGLLATWLVLAVLLAIQW